MNDIAPELLEKIQRSFERFVRSDPVIASYQGYFKVGRYSAESAQGVLMRYSKALGENLQKAFKENVSDSVLPNGRMYYNIAEKLINPMLEMCYRDISKKCANVQKILNESANIKLEALKPGFDSERIHSVVQWIADAEKYSQRESSFLDSLSTYCKTVVDDGVRTNAEFHAKAGLNPKIIRIAHGKTCKWCQELASGSPYDYAEVSDAGNDVFRRHANCDCLVLYDPSDGTNRYTNVHSEEEMTAEEVEEHRKKILFDKQKKQQEKELSKEKLKQREKWLENRINDKVLYT